MDRSLLIKAGVLIALILVWVGLLVISLEVI
jgi:hypothetical protein